MGFYGNITNTSNTTFQFDKIYPNRLDMDSKASNDGVFIGRYVLVEYQQDAAYPIIYVNGDKFYSSPGFEEGTEIKFLSGKKTEESQDGFYKGEIGQSNQNDTITFYECTGGTIDGYAIFEIVNPNRSDYVANFSIDEAHYSDGNGFKGYDSTVWTKVSEPNSEGKLVSKYVNIADLNSVVPTFNLTIEAPTMAPITPHFDADSTNVNYNLHLQPSWGFRVAKKEGNNSDCQIKWEGETTSSPAAINFNGPGFEAQVEEDRNTSDGINKHDNSDNYISISPTGESGQSYYTHKLDENGNKKIEKAPDIQEMRINLPIIGNTISDVWDIVHGPNRNDYRGDGENSSLQGRLDSFDAFYDNQIPVKRTEDGTIVGSKINNALLYDDWAEKPIEILDDDGTDPEFDRDDAWIKTVINTSELIDNDKDLNSNGEPKPNGIDQRINSGISIHHSFHPTEDSATFLDKNTNRYVIDSDYYKPDKILSSNCNNCNNDYIELYTPYVDAKGHVVGKNIETITLPYGFKEIIVRGESSSTENPYSNDLWSIIADSTQDTLNFVSSNKWIKMSGFDSNDTFSIGHEVNPIITKNSEPTNLNTQTGNEKDNLIIYDWNYDEAGHITEKKSHTYTLPYGFKTIRVYNNYNYDESTSVAKLPSTNGRARSATNTQDEIRFSGYNKWIRVGILPNSMDEDNVYFGHSLAEVASVVSPNPVGGNEEAVITFNNYNDEFDEAGHLKSTSRKEIILPFGYGRIVGDNEGEETSATASFDTLTITGDDWVIPTVLTDENGNSKIKFAHGPAIEGPFSRISETPGFGDTFTIPDYHFDMAGHQYGITLNTVKIPQGSYFAASGPTPGIGVITSLSFEPSSGRLTSTMANTNTLRLEDYQSSSTNNKLNIQDGNTINGAFAKIENYINSLDLPTSKTDTDWISDIEQVNGQVSIKRAGTNTFKLNGYDSQGQGTGLVENGDVINIAFAKLQNQITAEKEARESAINTLYGGENIAQTFDTIKEIADFLEQDSSNGRTGVEVIIDDVTTLKGDITTLKGDKQLEGSVAHSIDTAIKTAIGELDSEKAVQKGFYLSGIKIVDGKIQSFSQTPFTSDIKSGEDNGTILIRTREGDVPISVGGLKSAAYTESSDYATAAQGEKADTAVQSTTTFDYGTEGQTKTIQELANIIRQQDDKIQGLELTVQQLDERLSKLEPSPSPSIPYPTTE